MTNYNDLSTTARHARAESKVGDTGIDSGWCNGNPREQIQFGSYKNMRGNLKGFTVEQMKEFDAEDKRVNGDSKLTIVERKIKKREEEEKSKKDSK